MRQVFSISELTVASDSGTIILFSTSFHSSAVLLTPEKADH